MVEAAYLASAGDYREFILAVKSCTMKSPCNVDAKETYRPSSLLSDSIFGGRAGVSVGMSLELVLMNKVRRCGWWTTVACMLMR